MINFKSRVARLPFDYDSEWSWHLNQLQLYVMLWFMPIYYWCLNYTVTRQSNYYVILAWNSSVWNCDQTLNFEMNVIHQYSDRFILHKRRTFLIFNRNQIFFLNEIHASVCLRRLKTMNLVVFISIQFLQK